MTDTGKRLQFADMAKGIAILGVVIYHLLAPCGVKRIIVALMDSFLITFFFFSGYFFTPGKRSVKESLLSRFRALMVPFFKWSLFFWVIGTAYLLITNQATMYEAVCCLRNYFAGMIWNRHIQNLFHWEYYRLGARYPFLAGMWFLPAMMFSNVLFIPVAEQTLKTKYGAPAAACGLILLAMGLYFIKADLPYNLQLIPFWAAIMLAGACFRQFSLFETKGQPRAVTLTRAVIAAGTAALVSIFFKEPATNLFRGAFPEPQVWYIPLTAVCGIIACYGIGLLCRVCEESGMPVKELAWCGSHSLTIYLLHEFFAWIIFVLTGFTVVKLQTADAATIFRSVIVCAVSLAFCIASQIAMEKAKEAFAKPAAQR